jgi:hypothetical protein
MPPIRRLQQIVLVLLVISAVMRILLLVLE